MVCMLLHELILKRQSRGGHAHKPHRVKEIFVLDFELIGLKVLILAHKRNFPHDSHILQMK